MGTKISDMTPKGSADGTENLAVDDSDTSKSILVSDIKDYIIAAIEAIASLGSVDGSDSVMMLENGTDLKPTDIDNIAQHAINTIWGKTKEASPDDADWLPLKDGGSTEKTITLAVHAEYVRATIEAAILDVSDLSDGSGALSSSDYLLVTQSGTGKRIQVSDLTTIIYASLAAHVTALAAAGATADGDVFYVLQSGVAKKITLANILAHAGNVIDGSGTAATLAQWVDTDTLQAGPSLVLAAAGFAAGSDTALPTTSAVRGEMDEIINDSTDIGADIVDADTFLIDDGGAGTQKKSTMSRLYTYTIESIIPPEVDGTLATGDTNLTPTKLVYNKTCPDSDGDDTITLEDVTTLGQIVSIYLGTKAGSDDAIIAPSTGLSYNTITLDAVGEIATLQWQGATIGWVILYTNGTVA